MAKFATIVPGLADLALGPDAQDTGKVFNDQNYPGRVDRRSVADMRAVITFGDEGTGRAPAAAPRQPLPAGVGVGKKAAEDGGGLAFPLTEKLPSPSVDVYRLTSADSVWTFEYPVQLDLTDGDGNAGPFYPADYSQWEAG